MSRQTTPRFEVDFKTRLEQRQQARNQGKQPKIVKRTVWVKDPYTLPEDASGGLTMMKEYWEIIDYFTPYRKMRVTEEELTMLHLRDYRIQYSNPGNHKFIIRARKNRRQSN